MKILMMTVLGLGLWMLGKKVVGQRLLPQTAAAEPSRSHGEDKVIQLDAVPSPIH